MPDASRKERIIRRPGSQSPIEEAIRRAIGASMRSREVSVEHVLVLTPSRARRRKGTKTATNPYRRDCVQTPTPHARQRTATTSPLQERLLISCSRRTYQRNQISFRACWGSEERSGWGFATATSSSSGFVVCLVSTMDGSQRARSRSDVGCRSCDMACCSPAIELSRALVSAIVQIVDGTPLCRYTEVEESSSIGPCGGPGWSRMCVTARLQRLTSRRAMLGGVELCQ